jgi:hypothetical protein
MGLNMSQSIVFQNFWEILSFNTWNMIALGAGVIIILESIARLILPDFSAHVGGRLVFAAVLIGWGLSPFFGWYQIWPLILIATGVSVMVGGIVKRK